MKWLGGIGSKSRWLYGNLFWTRSKPTARSPRDSVEFKKLFSPFCSVDYCGYPLPFFSVITLNLYVFILPFLNCVYSLFLRINSVSLISACVCSCDNGCVLDLDCYCIYARSFVRKNRELTYVIVQWKTESSSLCRNNTDSWNMIFTWDCGLFITIIVIYKIPTTFSFSLFRSKAVVVKVLLESYAACKMIFSKRFNESDDGIVVIRGRKYWSIKKHLVITIYV